MLIKLMYTALFIVIVSITVGVYNKISVKRKFLSKEAGLFMPALILESLANLGQIYTDTLFPSKVAFGFIYAFQDLIIYSLFYLLLEFADFKIKNKNIRIAIAVLTAADILSVMISIFTGHMFTAELRDISEYFVYYQSVFHPLMYIRLVFLYALTAYAFFAVFRRRRLLPSIYRSRYTAVLVYMVISFIWDGTYTVFNTPINTSVITYLFFIFHIYKMSSGYASDSVCGRIFSKLIHEAGDGVVIFDIYDKCIYYNDTLINTVGISDDREEVEELIKQWAFDAEGNLYKSLPVEKVISYKGETLYLVILVQELKDEQSKKIATIFYIKNNTSEALTRQQEYYKKTHDSLTGDLYNREGFYEEAERLIKKYPKLDWMIIKFNYKDFKYVNNAYGTKQGDEILKKTAKRLKLCMRDNSILARFYGDEFVLLTTYGRFIEDNIEGIIASLSMNAVGDFYAIYMNIGIYRVEEGETDISLMCDYATLAVNSVKENHGNNIGWYKNSMLTEKLDERKIVNSFDKAIANDEFTIFLQPQTETDGKVVGAEALVRWIKPDKGLIPPFSFIPALEKNGIIHQLDAYVWELAAKQLSKWKNEGKRKVPISVNVSAKDIFYFDLYKEFMRLVEKYDIDPADLKIEITESTFMGSPERYDNLIDSLHSAGFLIEMDDFGSGYSSLGLLKNISVDVLKLDRSFVIESEKNQKGKMILESVIKMAGTIGMSVIVEGVETKEQVNLLSGMGCGIFQGYYFAKPMPITEFEEKYM